MASRLDNVSQQRRQKLDEIRRRGIDPYPNRYHRSHTATQAKALLEKQGNDQTELPEVTVAGRLTAHRSMGEIHFLDIRDGSGKIQLHIHKKQLTEDSLQLLGDLDIGDIIGAGGKPCYTKRGEPSIDTRHLTLLAKSLKPLPEKWHGLQDVDTRYRQRYLDLISNPQVKETFRVRSRVIAAVRDFLNQKGFLEVETPMLQPSAGGAMARPFVTHHHALDHDFYLRIALELHLKRLIIGGFDRVYELGRTFRNEGISTRHNPEFTMLESYQAYADYNDVMDMLEEMVSGIVNNIHGGSKVEYADATIDFKPPWPRIPLRQAIAEQSGIDFGKFPDTDSLRAEMTKRGIKTDPSKDRGRLIDELLSTFVEPKLIQPTFLIDYPVDMSPLAKAKPGDDSLVERFEAFAGGMELANAFTELNDPIEQRLRFASQMKHKIETTASEAARNIDEEIETVDEDFLLALEHGMPPTGGLGVGIDRLVMLLTNQQSIREVIFFPQLREKE